MSCEHTNRCYGACCRKFVLGGLTLADLREDIERRARGEVQRFNMPLPELEGIVAMLVPNADHPEDPTTFTCRHLSTITGDCLNYEGRPAFCREYPNGKRCTFSACTYEAARNPLVQISRPFRLTRKLVGFDDATAPVAEPAAAEVAA